MQPNPNTALALDVGTKRIGVAVASLIARFPRPHTTLINDENFIENLNALIKNEGAGVLVVGLPRGMNGQDTDQTRYVQEFVARLQKTVTLPVHFQDEALTSVKAEAELDARGKMYQKGDIDALAAMYILEDFLNTGAKL